MKKKLLLLTLVLITIVGTTNAQSSNVKYQGDIQLGYSAGIGTFATDRVNLHMVNGVRINEYFSTGIGLGLDYYHTYNWYINNDYVASELVMPIFLNAKGYLPISKKTNLFLSMDLGCSIGLTEGVSGMSGFMMTPAVGASFKVAESKAITFSFGYNYQAWSTGGLLSINADALSLKVGFAF